MKITIDSVEYEMDFTKLVDAYTSLYTAIRTVGIRKPDGTLFVFNKNNAIRTLIKAGTAPFIVPFIIDLYVKNNLELVTPVKHEDLLDYSIYALLRFLKLKQGDMHVHLTSEAAEDFRRRFVSFSTVWQAQNETGNDTREIRQSQQEGIQAT